MVYDDNEIETSANKSQTYFTLEIFTVNSLTYKIT